MQKSVKNVTSQIEFKDFAGAIGEINACARLASPYAANSVNYNFSSYAAKMGQVDQSNLAADTQQVKKLGKNAISEIDFGNMDGLVNWLAHMH